MASNLVRAHKMLRPRIQMALKNAGLFQYLMYKNVRETKSGPDKN